MGRKVTSCVRCGERLATTRLVRIRAIAETKNGIVAENYCICPNCGTHNTLSVSDGELRHMRLEMSQLRERMDHRAQWLMDKYKTECEGK